VQQVAIILSSKDISWLRPVVSLRGGFDGLMLPKKIARPSIWNMKQ